MPLVSLGGRTTVVYCDISICRHCLQMEKKNAVIGIPKRIYGK